MIRLTFALCLAFAFCFVGSNADAAEPADSGVSQSTLSAMGLGGMQTIDRAESSEIRGQGSVTWGRSYSRTTIRIFGSTFRSGSTNGYRNSFPNFSAGGSFSYSNSSFSPFIYGGGFSIAGGF
ncbi:MAG: hypothetical protein P8L85_14075 [Rubripirellula sp.]|nr:hypothetical protein [Rubripirellula sp.]